MESDQLYCVNEIGKVLCQNGVPDLFMNICSVSLLIKK